MERYTGMPFEPIIRTKNYVEPALRLRLIVLLFVICKWAAIHWDKIIKH